MKPRSYYYKLIAKYKITGELSREEYIDLMSYADNDEEISKELTGDGVSIFKLPPPPEEELQKARLRLRRELVRLSNTYNPGLIEKFKEFFSGLFFEYRMQTVFGLVLFVLGFWAARLMYHDTGFQDLEPFENPASTVSYLDGNSPEILNLQISVPDIRDGNVNLEFDAVSRVRIEGSLEDQRVKHILAYALSGKTPTSTRLRSISLLGNSRNDETIKKSLINSLLNDVNPGVRLKALDALSNMEIDENLKYALLEVIEKETVPGIRIAAIDVLTEKPDKSTFEAIKTKAMESRDDYFKWKVKEYSKKVNLIYQTKG